MQVSDNLLKGAPALIAGVLLVIGVIFLLLSFINPLEDIQDYPENLPEDPTIAIRFFAYNKE